MATSPLSKEIQKLCRILLYEDGAGLSDGQLLERFVEHQDEAAFAAIVRRHSALVWGLCRRVVGHHHDAEDAFQATFLVLARKAVSVRPRDMLANWLYGVAHRTALKAKALATKRRTREKQVKDMPEAQAHSTATWRDLEPLLDQELAQLPDKYRIAILLCDLEGKTGKDAARLLKIPEGTLTSRLTRGRAMLAKRLARHGVVMSAGTVAGLLAQSASSAGVPAALVAATAKTAFLAAAGQTAAISATVAALTEGVMKAMLISKLKTAMVVALVLSMVGTGAGVSMHSALAPPAIAEPQPAAEPDIDAANGLAGQAVVAAHDGEEAPKKSAPRIDLYGDPLPEGAIARMGSLRFRHAGLSDFVCLPDGKTVLSAGSDRTLRFWDVSSGRQVRTVELQGTRPGRYVRLSPNGKLAATKDGKRLVVWEVDSGKELKTLAAPQGQTQYLCFSPDGKTLAVGRASDWRASLYDWQTGKERDIPLPLDPRRDRPGTDSAFHGSFSPDSKWFVAGASAWDKLGIFETATGREVRRLDCFAAMSTVSPDSRRLAVFSLLNNKGESAVVIRLFDLASGKELAQFPFDAEYLFFSLAFSPDGKTLACSFSDRSCLLDLATGRIVYHLPDRPYNVAFSPDGKMLMAQADSRLRIWDAATGKERHDRPGDFGYPPVLGVSPDGQRLAATTWMGKTVIIWDTRNGRLLHELPLKMEQNDVRNLAYTSDGNTLVASQAIGLIQFWGAATGKEERKLQLDDPDETVKDAVRYSKVHRSTDGKHISTLGRDWRIGDKSAELALWEAVTGKLIRRHWLPREAYDGAWLADGTSIAVPLKEGLTLLDVRSGLPRFRVPGAATAAPLAISPDDRLLAAVRTGAGNAPSAVGVWEVASAKEVATVPTGSVRRLALAPDNRSLVTTNEKLLQVWDLATGKERTRWSMPVVGDDGSGGLLLSSDGQRAFTANADGTALVWDLAPGLDTAVPLLVDKAGANELAGWWADLAGDAGRGYAAIWRLSELKGDAAVTMLRQNLKPVADIDFQQVRMHIKLLASNSFKDRENARMELEKLGSTAAPALRQALETTQPVEVRRRLENLLSLSSTHPPETLRQLRAIQVLERIASKDARRLLTELANGMPQAAQTQEAKIALQRLARGAP